MKYYVDTEFVEGTQTARNVWGRKRKTKPTIDLISIGLLAEDGKEYYAVSKDFNLKEAWNRSERKQEYWLRKNVLLPILKELSEKEDVWAHGENEYFTLKVAQRLINKYGKTNKQIAEEVKDFISLKNDWYDSAKGEVCHALTQTDVNRFENRMDSLKRDNNLPKFYGYYADYDWVVFCWLFGRMIDLPKGFPKYCIDLKQMLDAAAYRLTSVEATMISCPSCKHDMYQYLDRTTDGSYKIDALKEHPDYPKQTNEHNALADARWNQKLHQFLQQL